MQDISSLLELARGLAQQGRLLDAEGALRQVLHAAADNVEALSGLGMIHLQRGEGAQAVALFEQAARAAPADAGAHKNLGLARLALGRVDEARQSLEVALQRDPEAFATRLHLGSVLERLGRDDDALVMYFGAIKQAQGQGLWLSEASTPPGLRDAVTRAMRFVDAGRRRLFSAVLAPFIAQHGTAAVERVEQGMDVYLGERASGISDPLRRPLFFYVPGLPSPHYFARELVAWIAELENNTAAIRAELLALMHAQPGFVPFLGDADAEQTSAMLRGGDVPPRWDAFFFYRHGERYHDNCARCPQTSAILESLPLVRIDGYAPEICFSVLTPAATSCRTPVVTNTRVVCHLPLLVPEGLRAGGRWRDPRVARGRVRGVRRYLRARSLEPQRRHARGAADGCVESASERGGACGGDCAGRGHRQVQSGQPRGAGSLAPARKRTPHALRARGSAHHGRRGTLVRQRRLLVIGDGHRRDQAHHRAHQRHAVA
jgi:aspartate beta-hydroxylase